MAWAIDNDTRDPAHRAEALGLQSEALRYWPENPFLLALLLEYELGCGRDVHAETAGSAMRMAIAACSEFAEAEIERPLADFTQARMHLMLGEDCFAGLEAYARGIALVGTAGACVSREVLEDELRFLARAEAVRPQAAQPYRWARWLLSIALRFRDRAGGPASLGYDVLGARLHKEPFKRPVVIVAGGADPS